MILKSFVRRTLGVFAKKTPTTRGFPPTTHFNQVWDIWPMVLRTKKHPWWHPGEAVYLENQPTKSNKYVITYDQNQLQGWICAVEAG